jgi:3',5'-cyclic AMP phosphodiesterase CpdA
MRRLVHLSDLHFDRVDRRVCDAVVDFVTRFEPDLVVVSGDLTQRARREELRHARAFLDLLPRPQIVVPGNHDVPLYNVFRRILNPLGGYRQHIADDLSPFYADSEIAVLGLNTAHSWTVKGGALAHGDLVKACGRLQPLGPDVVKIIATHHPLPTARIHGRGGRVRRHPIELLVECGADIFLTGHLHLSHAGHTAARYRVRGRSAIVAEAGTATSTRMRGESNGFNTLLVSPAEVRVESLEWQPSCGAFAVAGTDRFEKTADGWMPSGRN